VVHPYRNTWNTKVPVRDRFAGRRRPRFSFFLKDEPERSSAVPASAGTGSACAGEGL
jgi:hypothetical protein